MFDRIILASQSPRRRELLAQLGLEFEIMPALGAEHSDSADPAIYVEDLARAKAAEIADKVAGEAVPDGEDGAPCTILIIGADTIVARGNEILGKPRDAADADHMLHMLQGATHQVYTGVSLVLLSEGSRREEHFHEKTDVTFGPVSQQEIDDYIATGDPMDKAGAYGIQSGAGKFITKIDGDYNNVVGLPVARLYQELKRLAGIGDAVQDRRESGTAGVKLTGDQNAVDLVQEADERIARETPDEAKIRERLDQQFSFLAELDLEKFIGRQTYLTGGVRKENDAEHAWHMAIMALVLGEYANEDVDMLRVVSMILLHDVVEIDAGDTYAYDPAGKKPQHERELAAADRIFALLPGDQAPRFRALWDEFEAWQTPEAKFAHACDNFQPLMLNRANEGRSWSEHGVHLSQVLGRNARSKEGAAEVWQYAYAHFIMPALGETLVDDVHR